MWIRLKNATVRKTSGAHSHSHSRGQLPGAAARRSGGARRAGGAKVPAHADGGRGVVRNTLHPRDPLAVDAHVELARVVERHRLRPGALSPPAPGGGGGAAAGRAAGKQRASSGREVWAVWAVWAVWGALRGAGAVPARQRSGHASGWRRNGRGCRSRAARRPPAAGARGRRSSVVQLKDGS